MSIDQLQRQYRYKGKFPIIISCRFKDKMVEEQKEGEWIDKTFLGMIYFTRLNISFQASPSFDHLVLQIVPHIYKFKCEDEFTENLNFNHTGDYEG